MPIPDFESNGDLPVGLHQATFDEVLTRFGTGTFQREAVTRILTHIHAVALATGQLERFIIYGSYVTAKENPRDVDVFLVMKEDFTTTILNDEAKLIFRHAEAEDKLGASIFWVTRGRSFATINFLIEGWQTTRDDTFRGIVEVAI
jgi:hypothetical protein